VRAGGRPSTVYSGLHPYYGSEAAAGTSVRLETLDGWLRGLAGGLTANPAGSGVACGRSAGSRAV
jgi:hypothetical protein